MAEVQMALLEAEARPARSIELKEWRVCSERAVQANAVRNQRYTLLTFLPRVLYQQFRYFFNLFYLLTALSQFVPALKVGLLFSFLAPLALVLFLTMAKEAYEDYQRYVKDQELNSAPCTLCVDCITKLSCPAADLCLGDLIELSPGQSVPADCIIALNASPGASLFLKTDQLDGETDWKARKAIFHSFEELRNCRVDFTEPAVDIYRFEGAVHEGDEGSLGLGLEHTAWRGARVAAGSAIAMVVYVGAQTKLSLNMKQSEQKFGKLDEELNFLSKALFALLVGMAALLVLLRARFDEAWSLFFRYFLLLSSIIPISMRVNLDFAKLIYKRLIDTDSHMPGALCRNSNIPEELGRVKYILSDKTGTLTKNEMVLRKLWLSDSQRFDAEDILLKLRNSSGDRRRKLSFEATESVRPISLSASSGQTLSSGQTDSVSSFLEVERTSVREKVPGPLGEEEKLHRALLGLLICHNVTPVLENGGRVLQGSSPDEVTLVSFAEELGYRLERPSGSSLAIYHLDKLYEFEVLEMFPFTSESKSMGVLVRRRDSGQVLYYLKGADTALLPKIASLSAQFAEEACSDMAREGLRTLVFALRPLSEEFYEHWKERHRQALASLKGRTELVRSSRAALEAHMTFLGVSGVEDKLQDGVAETIGSFRGIGLSVWMLTGDKVETAICIARSVKLVGGDCGLRVLEKADEAQVASMLEALEEELRCRREVVLVLDGESLGLAIRALEERFLKAALKLPALVCCRVTPTQKAEMARLVMKHGEGRVLGIGDGGNDVALIQTAHVGVGLYGKEGVQAALASDFSVARFADLGPLLLWHGRLAYRRSWGLAHFVIHRGTIITVMQFIFCLQYHFVALPVYNGVLLLGYSTVFTMLPVFSLVLDEDISRAVALQYPLLYLTKRDETLFESFASWLLVSIYQGAVIMLCIGLIPSSFYMLTTLSFTSLILIEFLNVAAQLHRLRLLQVASILVSVGLYSGTMFLMHTYLNGVVLFSSLSLLLALAIAALAWIPPFAVDRLQRSCHPSEEQKIMRNASP